MTATTTTTAPTVTAASPSATLKAADRVHFRAYQIEAQAAVREAWEAGDEAFPMVVLPTGTGKTLTVLQLVVEALERGERVLWGAHRTELLNQPFRALCRFLPQHGRYVGIVQASKNDASCRCIFGSLDTLRNKKRREDVLRHGAIDLLVVDEAHHAAATTYTRVLHGLKPGRVVGMTATPHREDGKALGDDWEIVASYAVTTAIEEGYLVPPMAVVLPVKDIDPAMLAAMDDEAQGEALIAAHVVEHTVEALTAAAHLATALPERERSALIPPHGRRWLGFTASVRQAELTAEALNKAGLRAAAASGATSADERQRLLDELSAGRLDAVFSPMIFTEGTDCPAVDGVLIIRACSGWATYVQCVGRGLRLFPGKTDCLVLDFSGASKVHDLRAAPVLIGGTPCPEALDSVHVFIEDDKGRAVCAACRKTLACFAAKGPHQWAANHRCKACNRPQCAESPDGAHEWIRADDVQICAGCGCETKIRTPMIPKLGGQQIEADWVQVPGLSREIVGIRVGDFGTVLVVPDRAAGTGVIYWIVKGGRKARKRGGDGVPLAEVRAWCADLLSSAERLVKTDAEWKFRRLTANMARHLEREGLNPTHYGTLGDATRALTRKRCRDKAVSLGLAEPLTWNGRAWVRDGGAA